MQNIWQARRLWDQYFSDVNFFLGTHVHISYLAYIYHDDVIKRKIFRVTGHLCGEFTGHRWIPRTKASDAELWCFLWSAPEYRFE